MAKKKEQTNESLINTVLERLYIQRDDLEDQQSELDDAVNLLNSIIPDLERASGDIGLL